MSKKKTVNTRCAFYSKETGEAECLALRKLDCEGCRFFQTKKELAEARKASFERRKELGRWFDEDIATEKKRKHDEVLDDVSDWF